MTRKTKTQTSALEELRVMRSGSGPDRTSAPCSKRRPMANPKEQVEALAKEVDALTRQRQSLRQERELAGSMYLVQTRPTWHDATLSTASLAECK